VLLFVFQERWSYEVLMFLKLMKLEQYFRPYSIHSYKCQTKSVVENYLYYDERNIIFLKTKKISQDFPVKRTSSHPADDDWHLLGPLIGSWDQIPPEPSLKSHHSTRMPSAPSCGETFPPLLTSRWWWGGGLT
jgi:hypothetical protein